MKDLDIKYRDGRFHSMIIDGHVISAGGIRQFTLSDEACGLLPTLNITLMGKKDKMAIVNKTPTKDANEPIHGNSDQTLSHYMTQIISKMNTRHYK
jgi:hypothetical protein